MSSNKNFAVNSHSPNHYLAVGLRNELKVYEVTFSAPNINGPPAVRYELRRETIIEGDLKQIDH